MSDDTTLPTPTRDSAVTLREITFDNLRAVFKLETTEQQRNFVAPVPWSLAQASLTPTSWQRAIYADDTPVGYVLMDIRPTEDPPTYYIWRYLIDTRYQRLGFGARALQLIIDHVRTTYPAAEKVTLSYVRAEGGPQPFYLKFGFLDTEEMDDDEYIMVYPLTPIAA